MARALSLSTAFFLISRSAFGGAHFERLKSFGFDFPQNPQSALIEGNDGALIGATFQGGSGLGGTLFRVQKDGTGYRVSAAE